MEDMSISAEQIRTGRERLRMTQKQLADTLGVSQRTIGNWERGETIPRNRLAPLAEVLRLDDPPKFGPEALLQRLGQLAKRRREEIGMGRQPFAKEIGLGSDRTLVEFEFGRHLPTVTTQLKIERGLGWRPGAIDDTMRDLDRKAENITMESLDAEDSLHIAAQTGPGLALVSDEDLLAELARRLAKAPAPFKSHDVQNLYGLAASTNSEHLEDEDGNRSGV